MPDCQNEKLSSMLEDLQSQLLSCNDAQERISLRAAIKHLRATQDLLNPNTNLRRSRRKHKLPDRQSNKKVDDLKNANIPNAENKSLAPISPSVLTSARPGAASDKEASNRLEKRLRIPPDSLSLSISSPVEVPVKNLTQAEEASVDPGIDSSRRRSRPSLSHIFKLKSPKSPKDPDPRLSSPTDESEESSFSGKRRFSKRFRKRSVKSSADVIEPTGNNVIGVHSLSPLSSDAEQSSEKDLPTRDSNSEHPSSSKPGESLLSASDVDKAAQSKHSARDKVKRVIGRFFPVKHSKHTVETSVAKPPDTATPSSASCNETFPIPEASAVANHSVKSQTSPNSVESHSPRADRKQIESKAIMAEVLHQPHDVAIESERATPTLVDCDATKLKEPSQPSDSENKESKEGKVNTNSNNNIVDEPDFSAGLISPNEKTCSVHLKETSLSDDLPAVVEPSPVQEHVTSSACPPWAPEQVKKTSFRSVHNFTRTSGPPTPASNSNSTPVPSKAEKNSSATAWKSFSEETKSTPSRFGNREYSASFRTHRPAVYKPPDHVKNRSGSFRLSRPKDFIKQVSPDPVEQVAPNPVPPRSNTFSTPLSSSSKSNFPSEISPVDPIANLSRSSSLQRSESCKENQKRSSDIFNPSRRKTQSQRILSRVLSLKIDSEKATHRRQAALDKKSFSTSKHFNRSLPVNPSALTVEPSTVAAQNNSLPSENTREVVEIPFQGLTECQEVSDSDSSEVQIAEDLCEENQTTVEVETDLPKDSNLVNSNLTETDNLLETKLSNQSNKNHQSPPFNFIEYLEELIGKVDSIVNQELVCDKGSTQLTEEQVQDCSSLLRDSVSSTEVVAQTSTSPVPLEEDPARKSSISSTSDSSLPPESESPDNIVSENSTEKSAQDSQEHPLPIPLKAPEDQEDPKEMEGRSVLISRRSARTGSVKSRILASESWITSSGKGSEAKKAPAPDVRMFRNTEGIRSRMNKFSPVTSSSTSQAKLTPVKSSVARKLPDSNNNNVDALKLNGKAESTQEKSIAPKSPNAKEEVKEVTETKLIITNGFARQPPSVKTPPGSASQSFQIKSIEMSGNVRVVVNSQSTTDKTKISSNTDASLAPLVTKSSDASLPQAGVKEVNGISSHAPKPEDDGADKNILKVVCSTEAVPNTISSTNTASNHDSSPLLASSPTRLRQDDVIEENSPRSDARPARTRRRRSSNKDAVVSAAPSDDTSAKTNPNDRDKAEPSSALEVPPSAPRRRRRVRKSSDKASPSGSAATTPDRDTEVFVAPKIVEEEKPATPPPPRTPDKTIAESPTTSVEVSESPVVVVSESPVQSAQENNHVTADAVDVSREAKCDVTITKSEDNAELKKPKRSPSKSEVANNTETRTIENDRVNVATSPTSPVAEIKSKDESIKETNKQMAPQMQSDIRYTIDNVEQCADEAILRKMLDAAVDFEGRSRIRAVLRAVKKKKEESLEKKKTTSPSFMWNTSSINIEQTSGLSRSKSVRVSQTRFESSSITRSPPTSSFDTNSLANKYSFKPAYPSSGMSSGTKKVGSIFDREDDPPRNPSSRINPSAKREIVRNRSMPSSSTKDARKLFVAKLEGDGGPKGSKKIGRSPTFVVPNANNVKQMLLKWCQSKTRAYDNVDITNFSGSWANGLAFCALVHNFFPDAFDYSELDAKNRAHNFELAFTTAEKLANADPLLDVEDMMIMGNRPDSKCVFTYAQSLYNKLRRYEKPLEPLSDEKKEGTSK